MSVEVKKEVVEAVAKDVKEAEAQQAVAAQNNVMAAVVHDPNAPIITLKKLLEAGVHYGHQTRKWNPKMGKYIYCPRNGIYIIDLNKSRDAIDASYEKLREIVADGGKVLFVGTKIQAKQIVEAEAIRSGSFYVTNRWLGGVLTNFKTIQTRIRKLKDLEDAEADGSWDKLTKKEVIDLKKLKAKLSKNLEGIKEMRKLPNAIVAVDPTVEHNAIKEANKLGIPVFAICDTNCNPDNISYVIPGNDDATKSIQLIVGVLSDAVCEAKGGLTTIAYTKDEGEEVSMKDAIRQADRENALRLAARRELQRERLEKEKARRDQYESRFNKPVVAKSDAPVSASEEKPVEKKVEDTKEETK